MSSGVSTVYENVYRSPGRRGGLFDGKTFWVAQRCPNRAGYVEMIKNNGGAVVALETKADIMIVDHLRSDTVPGGISYRYIEKSIRNGRLEDPDDHATGPSRGSVRSTGSLQAMKRTKTPFSAADDLELYTWVKDYERRDPGAQVKGNEIYKQLEQKNTRHTWQSWRDRYIKQLMYKPPANYKRTERLSSPPEKDSIEPEPEPPKSIPRTKFPKIKPVAKTKAEPKSTAEQEFTRDNLPHGFSDHEYQELYYNASNLLQSPYEVVTDLERWNGWAEATKYTGPQWFELWETVVKKDWDADDQETRDTKVAEFGALISERNSRNSSSDLQPLGDDKKSPSPAPKSPSKAIQKSVRFTAKETNEAAETSRRQNVRTSEPLGGVTVDTVRQESLKRDLTQRDARDEIPETQLQDIRSSPKRRRMNEVDTPYSSVESENGTNDTPQTTQASVVIELSSGDEDDENDENDDPSITAKALNKLPGTTASTQGAPVNGRDDIATQRTFLADSPDLMEKLIADFPDAETMMDNGATLVSQDEDIFQFTGTPTEIIEEIDERGMEVDTAGMFQDHTDASPGLFVSDDDDDEDNDAHERDTPRRTTEDHTNDVPADVELSAPEGSWDSDAPDTEAQPRESSARSHDSTPRQTRNRPVFNTQAILQSNTQELDLDLPQPPDLSEDEDDIENTQARNMREVSVATDLSEAPLDGDEMTSLVKDLMSQGYKLPKIVEVLMCTSNYQRLVKLVVESFNKGKGIPDDIPGVWTAEDDQALDSTDARDFNRVEDKHGAGRVEERMEFLRNYRS